VVAFVMRGQDVVQFCQLWPRQLKIISKSEIRSNENKCFTVARI
jgi:hypothetical protein